MYNKTPLIIFLKMTLYKFLTLTPLIFAISFSTQAEIFKLLSSKEAKEEAPYPDATVKKYQAIKPVNVIYNYGLDPDGEKYLSVSYLEKDTNFQDLLQFGSFIYNLKDPVVVNNVLKKMPKLSSFESCYYSGKAVLELKNIEMVVPETAGEADSYAEISKVIQISHPKKECHDF